MCSSIIATAILSDWIKITTHPIGHPFNVAFSYPTKSIYLTINARRTQQECLGRHSGLRSSKFAFWTTFCMSKKLISAIQTVNKVTCVDNQHIKPTLPAQQCCASTSDIVNLQILGKYVKLKSRWQPLPHRSCTHVGTAPRKPAGQLASRADST